MRIDVYHHGDHDARRRECCDDIDVLLRALEALLKQLTDDAAPRVVFTIGPVSEQ